MLAARWQFGAAAWLAAY